ncbi:MAG: bifunctional riboflavin kinase/FAD synthetase [Limisphaerales bacterium]
MEIIDHPSQLQAEGRRVCVAVGVFDGVHLGHQQVLRQTLADAQQFEGIPVAITFDRHPACVLAPEHAPRMIYPLEKKLATIESLGVRHAYVIPFDQAFSERTGEDFITGLVADFGNLASICVGSAFTFGHQRSGDVKLLRELGAKHGFQVHGLAAVSLDDEAVSSTRIRAAITGGDLDAAGQMLGRAYTLGGPVIQGAQLGCQLGFPTANIDVSELATPPHGVYAVHIGAGDRSWRAALNIGVRPTVREAEPTLHVEAHLLDFDGDLYDEKLEITFVKHLRPEQKFPDLNALCEQIAADVATTRTAFG